MLPSERLREAIKASGKSLGSLARESGSDTGNLSKFVAGKAGMKLDLGIRLAAILGVEFEGEEGQVVLGPAVTQSVREDPFPMSPDVVVKTGSGVPAVVNRVTPRPSTPSCYSGGPKRADDKRPLTEREKNKRKGMKFQDGG